MSLFNKPSSKLLAKETITPELKNALWSFYYSKILESTRERYITDDEGYFKKLWTKHFKQPITAIPSYISSWSDRQVDTRGTIEVIAKHFSSIDDWEELYSIFEFTFPFIVPPCKGMYRNDLNEILTEERSALRFVENTFVEITDQRELIEIRNATSYAKEVLDPVYTHLDASIRYLGQSNKNDYRNSIKESISAVESMCKIYANDEDGTLGSAIKKLNIHPAFKKSIENLYGFTSQANGIRHGLKFDDEEIEFADAKYILVNCCAFVNYLKAKMG
jgi:hypothetical protein